MPVFIQNSTKADDAARAALKKAKTTLYDQIVASDPGGGRPVLRPSAFRRGGLQIQLTRVIRDLTRYTEASIKLCILEATEELIKNTPKDTFWASVSWFPNYGQTVDNGGYLVDPDAFEFEGQSVEDLLDAASSEELVRRGIEQAAAITAFTATKIFVNQYIARSPQLSNGVPYIEDLNQGKSDQASPGFVERGLAAGLTKLEVRANAAAFAGGRRVRFI